MNRRLLVLMMLFSSCLPSPAFEIGFQPIQPEELAMGNEPNAPGAPAIILYRQVDQDDSTLNSRVDNYFRIKILTEEGRKYADTQIRFLKSMETVTNLNARTIKPDGTIVDFNGEVFEKEIAKIKGQAYLAKVFTFPDVQVGGILEYTFTFRSKGGYVIAPHWILSQDLFTKSAKFSLRPYSRSASLRWIYKNLPAGAAEPQQEFGIVKMYAQNIPAFQTEEYMPPEDGLKARVNFVYTKGPVETDPVKFWKKFAKENNDALQDFIAKQDAMRHALEQIVAPEDSPEIKLQKIYARVQQLRNTTYEISRTEQEEKRAKEKRSKNVEQVWKAGGGLASELTWLFLALARAAGFEAYDVLVGDRLHYVFDSKFLDESTINTNVVLVKLNGKDLYCDPGARFVPYGLLPWPETGVPGLRLDGQGETWVRTPLPDSSESRIERRAQLKLDENGDLEGNLTITFTGLEAVKQRTDKRDDDEAQRKKGLENEVKETVPANVEVELVNKPDWTASSRSLVAEFQLKIPGWVSRAGRHALMPVGFFSSPEKRLFEHGERRYPVYMEFPYTRVDDVVIELPKEWQVSHIATPKNEDVHTVGYSLHAERDGTGLHVVRTVKVNFLILKTEYYPALRGFFQMVRTGDEDQIVLQPGTADTDN